MIELIKRDILPVSKQTPDEFLSRLTSILNRGSIHSATDNFDGMFYVVGMGLCCYSTHFRSREGPAVGGAGGGFHMRRSAVPFRENFARVCFQALLRFSFINSQEATIGEWWATFRGLEECRATPLLVCCLPSIISTHTHTCTFTCIKEVTIDQKFWQQKNTMSIKNSVHVIIISSLILWSKLKIACTHIYRPCIQSCTSILVCIPSLWQYISACPERPAKTLWGGAAQVRWWWETLWQLSPSQE